MALTFGAAATNAIDRTTNLPGTTAFSILCWIFPTTVAAGDRVIASNGNIASFNSYDLFISTAAFAVWNGSAQTNGSNLVANAWRHVALTVNGTSGANAKAYLDGVLNISSTARAVGAGNVRYGNNAGSESFVGRLAAFKVYSAVLTPEEIVQEMRCVEPIRTANLNDWRPLWNSSDVVDYSGNGNASTTTGTLATVDGPPIPYRAHRRRIVYFPAAVGPPPSRRRIHLVT